MADILIKKTQHHGWGKDHDMEWCDEALLSYSTGLVDEDKTYTVWEEWRLEGKIVKRAVHVHIKEGHGMGIELQVG